MRWPGALSPGLTARNAAGCQHPEHLPGGVPRRSIMVWLKEVGRKILSGSLDLVNISFPVGMRACMYV